jgi:chromosome segregation ATPase
VFPGMGGPFKLGLSPSSSYKVAGPTFRGGDRSGTRMVPEELGTVDAHIAFLEQQLSKALTEKASVLEEQKEQLRRSRSAEESAETANRASLALKQELVESQAIVKNLRQQLDSLSTPHDGNERLRERLRRSEQQAMEAWRAAEAAEFRASELESALHRLAHEAPVRRRQARDMEQAVDAVEAWKRRALGAEEQVTRASSSLESWKQRALEAEEQVTRASSSLESWKQRALEAEEQVTRASSSLESWKQRALEAEEQVTRASSSLESWKQRTLEAEEQVTRASSSLESWKQRALGAEQEMDTVCERFQKQSVESLASARAECREQLASADREFKERLASADREHQELTRGLEGELSVVRRQLALKAEQLASQQSLSATEARRWRDLSEERHSAMQRLEQELTDCEVVVAKHKREVSSLQSQRSQQAEQFALLQEELERSVERCDSLYTDLNKARASNGVLSESLDQLRRTHRDARLAWDDQETQLREEILALERHQSHLQAKLSAAEATIAGMEADRLPVDKRLSRLAEIEADTQQQLKSLTEQHARQLASLREALDSATNENAEMVTKHRDELGAATAERDLLRGQLDQARSDRERLSDSLGRLREELVDVNGRLAASEAARGELVSLAETRRVSERDSVAQASRIDALEASLHEQRDASLLSDRLEHELETARARYREAEEALSEANQATRAREGELERLSTDMEAAVSQQLRLEAALEAANEDLAQMRGRLVTEQARARSLHDQLEISRAEADSAANECQQLRLRLSEERVVSSGAREECDHLTAQCRELRAGRQQRDSEIASLRSAIVGIASRLGHTSALGDPIPTPHQRHRPPSEVRSADPKPSRRAVSPMRSLWSDPDPREIISRVLGAASVHQNPVIDAASDSKSLSKGGEDRSSHIEASLEEARAAADALAGQRNAKQRIRYMEELRSKHAALKAENARLWAVLTNEQRKRLFGKPTTT